MEMFDYNNLIEDRRNGNSPPMFDDDFERGGADLYSDGRHNNKNRPSVNRSTPLRQPAYTSNQFRPINRNVQTRHPHFRYTPQRTIPTLKQPQQRQQQRNRTKNRSLPSIVIDPEIHPDSYPLYNQRRRRPVSCSPYPYRLPPPILMMSGRRRSTSIMPEDEELFAHYDNRRPSVIMPPGIDEEQLEEDEVDEDDYNGYLKYQQQRQQQNPSYLYDDGAEFGEEEEATDADVDDDDVMINNGTVKSEPILSSQVGIYGWRKKITYLLLAIIVLLVGINFALTFWIVSFLGFSSNGISGLDLSFDVITFNGDAIFKNILYARDIGSYQDQSLRFMTKNSDILFRSGWNLDSDQKFTENSSTTNNNTKAVDSKLTLTKNNVRLETDNFEIYDKFSRKIFALNTVDDADHLTDNNVPHSQMTITADSLNFQNLNGLRIPLSIQTTLIESSTIEELKIFAPQSRMLIRAPKSVAIQSKLGDTSMITFGNLVLRANGGKIVLETGKSIFLRRLTLLETDSGSTNSSSSGSYTKPQQNSRLESLLPKPQVFQLCICQSGKVFLAKPDSVCAIQTSKDCH